MSQKYYLPIPYNAAYYDDGYATTEGISWYSNNTKVNDTYTVKVSGTYAWYHYGYAHTWHNVVLKLGDSTVINFPAYSSTSDTHQYQKGTKYLNKGDVISIYMGSHSGNNMVVIFRIS